MQAEVITIGDELLIGQVVDTNSAFIAREAGQHGIAIKQITSVHDERQHIVTALSDALKRADIVFLTGGLGPTKDDITKLTLAEFFSTRLVESEEVRQHILTLYHDRPQILNRLTETQWQVPENALILPNRVGSAPLMLWNVDSNSRKQIVVSMPGVPYEMEIAMTEQILPYIDMAMHHETQILHRNVLVYGIPESTLALQILQWEESLPQTMHLAYLPKDGIVRLRLSSYGEHTLEQLDIKIAELLPLLGDAVIATEDLPIEVLVANELKRLHSTVSTAESCTGGKLAVALNRHAGSSAFYMGSVVAYDNQVKQEVLGVSEDDLQTFGAVSEPVVRQMAEGVRHLLKTDYAIATSGIAGPDGGTKEKPVGTVWVAVATPIETFTECFHFGTLREKNTDRATLSSLIKLLRILQNK